MHWLCTCDHIDIIDPTASALKWPYCLARKKQRLFFGRSTQPVLNGLGMACKHMLADREYVVAAYNSVDVPLGYQAERRGPLLYHGSIPTMLCFSKLENSSTHFSAPLDTLGYPETKLSATVPQLYVKMRLQLVAIFSLFTLGLALPVLERRSRPGCVGEQLMSLSSPLAPTHLKARVTDIRQAANWCSQRMRWGTWNVGLVLRKSICYAPANFIKQKKDGLNTWCPLLDRVMRNLQVYMAIFGTKARKASTRLFFMRESSLVNPENVEPMIICPEHFLPWEVLCLGVRSWICCLSTRRQNNIFKEPK